MVSHKLRTPLTSIRGGLQLVLADPDAIADPNGASFWTARCTVASGSSA